MTTDEIIDLCRDIERLAFRDDLTANTPRRFDTDPVAYEALKQRVRERGMGYKIGWDNMRDRHYVKCFWFTSRIIKRDNISEPLAFMQALRAAMNKDCVSSRG